MSNNLFAALYIGTIYALGAGIFGGAQVAHNRRHGRSDPHYASAWFVGAAWYPLLVWVLCVRFSKFVAARIVR